MRCIRCGSELASEDRFCGECGAPRPQLPPRFAETEDRFAGLQARYRAGELDDDTYDEQLQGLVVEDETGGHWMLGSDSGDWYWYDGQQWVRRDPPQAAEPVKQPDSVRPSVATPVTRKGPPCKWVAMGCGGLLVITVLIVAGLALCGLLPLIFPSEELGVITGAEATAAPTRAHVQTPLSTVAEPGGFEEEFDDRSGGWIEKDAEDRRIWIDEGEYHISIETADRVTTSAHLRNRCGDFVLAAVARQVSDLSGFYGLVFRYQDTDNFYHFVISDDGRYRIRKQLDDEWVDIVEWTFSSAINQGQAENTLMVACVGDEISAWVNDQELTTVWDDSFGDGFIGLTAGAWEPGVHVAFDWVAVEPVE